MHFNAGLPTDALLLAAGATENTHSLVSFAWIMAAALMCMLVMTLAITRQFDRRVQPAEVASDVARVLDDLPDKG